MIEDYEKKQQLREKFNATHIIEKYQVKTK
jgi:hypothetical protein